MSFLHKQLKCTWVIFVSQFHNIEEGWDITFHKKQLQALQVTPKRLLHTGNLPIMQNLTDLENIPTWLVNA